MRWYLLVVFLLASALMGCENRSARILDRQAAELIRHEHARTLGEDAPADPRPVPPRAVGRTATKASYDRHPSTRNPSAQELPAAAPATTRPAGEMPSVSLGEEDPAAVRMNLEQALGYAIVHSPDYRNRKEDLFLAALGLLIEKHLWGPRFFDTITAQVSGTPEGGDHDQALQLINSFTVTQRLPYGGSVSASALVDFVEFLRDADPPNEEGRGTALNFAAELPLLRGAGRVAQEDLIQTYRDLVYATRDFERFRREFLLQVSSRYFDLLLQRSQIATQQRQLTNLERLARRTAALADAGREPYFEVQRSEQQVLFARNNLINAVETYSNQLDAFKILIGMPTTDRLVIEPYTIQIPEPALEPDAAVRTARLLRLDLQNSADRVEDARRRVEVARNALLPDLDLFADTTINTRDRQRDQPLNLGSSTYRAGVRLGLPLDRRVEQIVHRRTLSNLERAERGHTLLVDRVALQVRQSIRNIRQSRFTLALQNRNIEIALMRQRGVELDLARLGPRDFIEAQEDLLRAENRRDAALRDLRVSILQYLLDSGQLRVTSAGQWLPPAQIVPAIELPPGSEPRQGLQEPTAPAPVVGDQPRPADAGDMP